MMPIFAGIVVFVAGMVFISWLFLSLIKPYDPATEFKTEERKIMATYVHTAIVSVPAMAQFPIDMLRYDRCSPDRSQDVDKLHEVMRREHTKSVDIQVVRINVTKEPGWTKSRWESFGVTILHLATTRL